MSQHITLRKIKNAIKRLVEAKPDFEYDSEYGCFYMRDNCPSCLIGQALNKIGVAKKVLYQLDRSGYNHLPCSVTDKIFIEILALNGWFIDNEAIKFSSKVQDAQDFEKPWNKCYEEGLKTLDEYI